MHSSKRIKLFVLMKWKPSIIIETDYLKFHLA